MRKLFTATFIITAILAAVLAYTGPKAQAGSATAKITICHVPPGNPNNRHTIEVSMNALSAHLAHGDYIGSCDENDKGEGDTPDVPPPTSISYP
jgi:hypothetical protein